MLVRHCGAKSFLSLASLTLTAEIEHSSDAILAIKDINRVFALVLLSGLVDLKPELFFCHP